MTTIIERTPNRVTVSMSTRRWNRMLQLEETYKLARIIKRSMKQVESESAMTPEETIAALRALWKLAEDFRAAYKRLKKRHKSLEADFERLLASLLINPLQGVELEGGARKVRLAISSKGRGKSGGARVIIRIRIMADELQLLYIYDKSDFENINDTYLRDVMKRMDE